MNSLLILLPIALGLGGLGLAGFLWSIRSGQFSDPEGAAHRVLLDDDFPDDFQPHSKAKEQP